MSVRVGFLGTPEVAVPALEAVLGDPAIDLEVVITNPDRPKGRSRTPVPPPVKVAAEAAGLPVWQPQRPVEVIDELRALELDVCAVVAYGALLPASVLEVPAHGFVNLHFSLLPRWRGAAPVQHAIRAGDTVTGVTTFVLDAGLDTGPVLERVEVPIDPEESAGELLERLAKLGGPVLARSITALVGGRTPEPQPAEGVTLAPKITPDDVAIDLDVPARELVDLVRSADPAPGAHTTFRGDRLKVYRATPVTDPEVPGRGAVEADADAEAEAGGAGVSDPAPGTIVRVDKRGVVVACADGAVRLDQVQPTGKARMDGTAFVNGYRPEVGERLGARS